MPRQIKSGQKIKIHGVLPTKEEVDAAWRSFWAKRGFIPPPGVSNTSFGSFELPSRRVVSHGEEIDED